MAVPLSRSSLATLLLATGVLLRFLLARSSRPSRHRILPPHTERVIIFGASSGTGAAIAKQYAVRGCKALVLVARRLEQLEEVKRECDALSQRNGNGLGKGGLAVLCVAADCTKDTDVVHVRKVVLDQLGGIDTVHITLGVSALLPLLGIAGVDPVRPTISPGSSSPNSQQQTTHPSSFALSSTYTAVNRACTANLTSTALLLTTFTPILQLSSPAPAIHILSSLAALFPAPTRALYGATKAAQLILAQGFELETESQVGLQGELSASEGKRFRKKVSFVYLCPGTILSGFRQSAVDVPPASSSSGGGNEDALRRAGVFDSTWDQGDGAGKKKKKSDGLRPEDVARRAIRLVDRQQGGVHTMKLFELVGRIAMVVAPWIPARVAHKKYGY
ncbi:unnamed protein product [Tilletia controversa]|uniref:NAD(P)-binding protein n=4 Tax=Tilletia TaxID=13289 RepID=A0A8X7MZT9_9BASI|nr:hypothetical protein CF336_g3238 [Tilletia laevis]KAE8204918.1 hypothetical protein CF328_g809 [Tilletia controversa]CAD6883871.1 unnamed protein product [Tilletia caries]KAE8255105.1 hypothetical protein A4X06_0g592 [Tilletia controversa]CAD6908166.1 unnamed protein product [Tilletia controversa]